MPNSRYYDVAVVGAGPAGCAAALALARNGLRTVVLEKSALPRYKTCGGGLLQRASRLLPSSVTSAVERKFFSVQLNFANSGLSYVVKRDEPMVYMTMRASLDYLLCREAQEAGAEILAPWAVRDLRAQESGMKLIAGQGELEARFVVVADGAQSLTAKKAGWHGCPHLGPALEYEVHLSDSAFAPLSKAARFDFDVIQGGYAWVFPKHSHLSIGIVRLRRDHGNLRQALSSYLRHLGISDIRRIERHAGVVPLAPRGKALARGRVLLTGDAAGLADPVTAEGLSHAIRSGQLAAQAIVDGSPDAASVAARYQCSLEADLLPELKAGRFLATCLYCYPRLRYWVFRLGGQNVCEFMGNVISGQASYREALRRPVTHLKLLAIMMGGAFSSQSQRRFSS